VTSASDYYMLECDLDAEEAILSGDPDQFDPDLDWYCGARFDRPPALPVRLVIEDGEAGSGVLPELSDVPTPVMTRRLMDTLTKAGVTNIDYYDCEIFDEAASVTHTSHVAYNLIGVVAAADLKQTRFASPGVVRLIDSDIDGLAIDPGKTRGALIFRLAEAVNGIVVHDSVRRVVLAAGITTLTFLDPGDWAG
jgi:hypothetical protein